MKKSLLNFLYKQSFQPNWTSIFINPFFLIRFQLFGILRKIAPTLEGKMLDFGCGRKPYKNLFVNVQTYIGLDIAKSGHDHQLSEVDVFYEGKKIPFEDDSFDSIFSSEVFEHIFNLEEILEELYRVLRKEGKMLITIPFIWGEHEKPYDYARYTSFAIRDILEKKGFQILSLTKTGNAPQSIVQLFTAYIHSFFPKNKYLSVLLTLLFIFPVHLVGGFVSLFLPATKDVYFNNVVLVTK